jgi:zinc transporter ZupT
LYSATVVHRTGHAISYDLVGSLPETLAVLSSVAQVLAVISVAWLYLRGRNDPRRLALAFAAAVAGFLAFTRFFSPQYLVWLVPFVLLLEPAAWVLTAVALVLAQVWFFHYRDVFALGGYVWLVFARDVLVLALFALTLVRLRGSAAEDEDSVLLEHEPPLGVPS